MPRRGDNIHKRSDGRWEGRYISGRKEDGKAVYKSVYAKSYSECSDKLRLAKCDLLPVSKPVTVSEVFSAWLLSRKNRVKQSTYVNYQTLFDSYICDNIGAMRVDHLNAFMLDGFADKLMHSGGRRGKGLSAVTVQAVMIMLRSVLEYGALEYDLPDPAKNISMPKTESSKINLFNTFEIAKLRSAALKGDSPEIGILLSLYTGLRIGELCALTWGEIDIVNQLIYIRKTLFRIKNPYGASPKTIVVIDTPKSKNSVRIIPIPTFMISALAKQKRDQPDHYYFLTCSENHTEPRTYSLRYRSFLKKLDIPYRKFHSLRHTFATECVKSGVDIKSLSELLGHSSVKTTLEKYMHSDIELKRRELEKLYSSV